MSNLVNNCLNLMNKIKPNLMEKESLPLRNSLFKNNLNLKIYINWSYLTYPSTYLHNTTKHSKKKNHISKLNRKIINAAHLLSKWNKAKVSMLTTKVIDKENWQTSYLVKISNGPFPT